MLQKQFRLWLFWHRQTNNEQSITPLFPISNTYIFSYTVILFEFRFNTQFAHFHRFFFVIHPATKLVLPR